MLNFILIFLIITTYFLNLFLLKKKIKLVEYVNVDFQVFPKIISDLSLSMNNQILRIEGFENTVILLEKYQLNNKWGIKVLINVEQEYEDDILNVFYEKNIEYQYYPNQDNKIDFKIDLGSDIERLLEIIKIILFNVFKLSTNTLFTCLFTKRSILTNL